MLDEWFLFIFEHNSWRGIARQWPSVRLPRVTKDTWRSIQLLAPTSASGGCSVKQYPQQIAGLVLVYNELPLFSLQLYHLPLPPSLSLSLFQSSDIHIPPFIYFLHAQSNSIVQISPHFSRSVDLHNAHIHRFGVEHLFGDRWYELALRIYSLRYKTVSTLDIESCNWTDFISVSHVRWYLWNCDRTQLETAPINQLHAPVATFKFSCSCADVFPRKDK